MHRKSKEADREPDVPTPVLSEDIGGAKKLTKGDLEDLFRFE